MLLNKILISITIIFILIAILFEVNYLNYSQPIPYSNFKEISLNDFKGLKKINSSLYGENHFAFITSEIRIQKENNQFIVESFFHPSRSYIYNRNIVNNLLLTHELYHFHITEYITRLIRQEITNKKNKVSVSYLQDKYFKIERQLQRDYDTETYHSYALSKQKEWEKKIDSCINSLNKYKNTH